MAMNKQSLVLLATLFMPFVAMGAVITIVGSSTAGADPGDVEFTAQSIHLQHGQEWVDSVKTVGDVTLTVSQRGADDTLSQAGWNANYSRLGTFTAGSDINFNAGADNTTGGSSQAVLNNTFISFQFLSPLSVIRIADIQVSLWRNGDAAATQYQFAVPDSNGNFIDNGVSVATFLGSPTSNSGTGDFNVFAPVNSDFANTHEVRLYFWGTDNKNGNTHLFNVTANYFPVIPEPSSAGLILSGFYLIGLALRRRIRGLN